MNGCFNNYSVCSKIGPHNLDIISIIVGLLLGDGYAEKRFDSTRITVHSSSRNVSYLTWIHKFFYERGYCSKKSPTLVRQVGKAGKVYFSLKFQTFSFRSFNFFRESFYDEQGIKVVSQSIEHLLTPFALAVWFMDDGSAHNSGGCVISTNSFTLEDCKRLQLVLKTKWNLTTSLHFQNQTQYRLYFGINEIPKFRALVEPFLVTSMRYKLHLK